MFTLARGLPPRTQGDLGEAAARHWLELQGAHVFVPLSHSPHIDLIADCGRRLVRVQVKTCTVWHQNRWSVAVCTGGGNQSWNKVVKRLDPHRIDALFVLVADGRRWWIPAGEIGGGRAIMLGGPKYARFEVDDRPGLLTANMAAG